MAGQVAAPLGTLHPNIAPYGEIFSCADGGRMILAVGSDAQFAELCRVLGTGPLVHDAHFSRNTQRVQHRSELAALLAPAIAMHDRKSLLDALITAGVPCGAVLRIDEVMGTPAAQAMISSSVIDGVATRRLRGNVFRIRPL
jgi:crotonobetainyl-CoA:carnitine CoA-transferase CaiB-like acyl-CoA transferase